MSAQTMCERCDSMFEENGETFCDDCLCKKADEEHMTDNEITHPFFWDANQWFGTVDSVDKLRELLGSYEIEDILGANMAPLSYIDTLPENYHADAIEVRTGEMISFGFRREHTVKSVTLGEWAMHNGMDLRRLAAQKPSP